MRKGGDRPEAVSLSNEISCDHGSSFASVRTAGTVGGEDAHVDPASSADLDQVRYDCGGFTRSVRVQWPSHGEGGVGVGGRD